MKSNLRLLLGVALLFGISTGIYEYTLPLFLRAHHLSFEKMGVIFALAGLATVIARIYMGGLADIWGRKPLYSWALAVCGGATVLTPFWPMLFGQVLLKTLRDVGSLTRETIYPIILYEVEATGFLNRISKFRGVEYLLQAGGTLLAGMLIGCLGASLDSYQVLFIISGGALILALLCWSSLARETRQAQSSIPRLTLRELVNFDLHPNLRLLLIASMIFTFGMQLSHSFYLQLFFIEHFGKNETATSWIMVAHRITIGLPLLIVGNLRLRNFRAWYIWGLIIEGITMAGSALIPVFWGSVSIFLLHDLIGAGIWSPIQATLIQRYSRDETRGMEVGKVLAWSSLGGIAGPIVAGVLAEQSAILPYLASGIVMALSAIPIVWLNTAAPAPTARVTAPTA